jgi:hypothetical protein
MGTTDLLRHVAMLTWFAEVLKRSMIDSSASPFSSFANSSLFTDLGLGGPSCLG